MKKLTCFLPVLLVFICSCQLQKVVVPLYVPAKLLFPPDVKSVLVTSRYVPATGPYEDVQWGAYESVDSLKWSLSESIVDTLANRMAGENTFLVKVRHFPRMLRNNDANLPDPLPWEGLLSLAKKEYVQTLLIIEGFDLSKTPVSFNRDAGNFEAKYSIGVNMAIRVYEPDKMRYIDDSVYSFTSEFKGTGATEPEALKNLPDEKAAMFTACSNAATDYFRLIKPGELASKRYYYPKGDSSMLKASVSVKEGKWGRAESKWKWLAYNSKDTLIQAKSSFNMALICERDGRFNQAIGFARRSERLHPDKHTQDYIRILNKKILDFEDQVKQKKIIKKW